MIAAIRHWLGVLACAVSPDGHPGSVARVWYVERRTPPEFRGIDVTTAADTRRVSLGEYDGTYMRRVGERVCPRCGAPDPELAVW